jgi:hypothetical protein
MKSVGSSDSAVAIMHGTVDGPRTSERLTLLFILHVCISCFLVLVLCLLSCPLQSALLAFFWKYFCDSKKF